MPLNAINYPAPEIIMLVHKGRESRAPICNSSPMLFCQHSGRHMQRLFQAAAWLLAATIVVLSLGPPSVRPTTGAAHDLEHLLIFLATGMAFGLGYPRRVWLLTIALPTFAAAIEVAQKLGSRSSCADERFLGRYGGLMPWSWIIVRVFKAKSGGYPKVNGPTEFLPGGRAPPEAHCAAR